MRIKKLIVRIVLLPFGLLISLIRSANSCARDIENRWRFKYSTILPSVCIDRRSGVGANSTVRENTIINASCIGNYSYCGKNCLIQNTTIGNFCSIASNVVTGPGRHPVDGYSTSPVFYRKNNPLKQFVESEMTGFVEYEPITIGHDVWIGNNAIILDGINIGTGAVVAAGAVVTKEVPPYSIMGGVPAKVIRYRFGPDEIEVLLDSKWWLKSLSEIQMFFSKLNLNPPGTANQDEALRGDSPLPKE